MGFDACAQPPPFSSDKDLKTDGFSLDSCRNMVNLMDVSSGCCGPGPVFVVLSLQETRFVSWSWGLALQQCCSCLTGGRKEGVLMASGPPALYSLTLAAGFLARAITSAACLGPGSATKSPAWSHPMPSTFISRRKFLCFTSHGFPSLMCCCATQPLRHSSKGTRNIGLLSSNPSCPAVVDESSDRSHGSHGQCPACTRTCSWEGSGQDHL